MKFAKVFQQTLIEEDIPDDWIEAAIQYKVLKKCIARVVRELEFLGLSQYDLKLLLQNEGNNEMIELNGDQTLANNPIVAKYLLSRSRESNEVIPFLKITINNESEEYSDDGMNELVRLIRSKVKRAIDLDVEHRRFMEVKQEGDSLVLLPTTSNGTDGLMTVKDNEFVVMLKSDMEFFGMLNAELETLDNVRQEEQAQLLQEIDAIASQVTLLTTRTSDLYHWRELFKVYLDSEIFFRYNQTALKQLERGADQVKKNLEIFMTNVTIGKILEKMARKKSVNAFYQFVAVNERLLKVLQFQSINTTALRKILKKFDKRTSLNISSKFPALISKYHIFMSGSSLAQEICYVMQNNLLTVVPQLDDYSCPICIGIAFKPIRLSCGHLFCVRCLVKMKQRGNTDCPMCRLSKAIALADSSNLDTSAMNVIKKSFPREVKEKVREADKERYKEMTGGAKGCVIT